MSFFHSNSNSSTLASRSPDDTDDEENRHENEGSERDCAADLTELSSFGRPLTDCDSNCFSFGSWSILAGPDVVDVE